MLTTSKLMNALGASLGLKNWLPEPCGRYAISADDGTLEMFFTLQADQVMLSATLLPLPSEREFLTKKILLKHMTANLSEIKESLAYTGKNHTHKGELVLYRSMKMGTFSLRNLESATAQFLNTLSFLNEIISRIQKESVDTKGYQAINPEYHRA